MVWNVSLSALAKTRAIKPKPGCLARTLPVFYWHSCFEQVVSANRPLFCAELNREFDKRCVAMAAQPSLRVAARRPPQTRPRTGPVTEALPSLAVMKETGHRRAARRPPQQRPRTGPRAAVCAAGKGLPRGRVGPGDGRAAVARGSPATATAAQDGPGDEGDGRGDGRAGGAAVA